MNWRINLNTGWVLRFLIPKENDLFQAAGKWRRACLSSTQLSTYYVGNIEMNDLRRDAEEKLGEQFNLKAYHDQLLSYGTPPPKYVRWMMGL